MSRLYHELTTRRLVKDARNKEAQGTGDTKAVLRPGTPPGRKSAGRPHVPPHFPGPSRKTESMPQCRNIFWNASPGRSMSLHTQNLRQSPHHTGRKKICHDYGVCRVPKAWRRAQPLLSKDFACVLGVGEFCGRAFALRDRLSGKVCFCVPDLCPQQPFRVGVWTLKEHVQRKSSEARPRQQLATSSC